MLGMRLGLTKTYNLFHSQQLRPVTSEELALEDKPFEKLLDKEATHLRKHLARTPEATLSFNEAVAGITYLRHLHVQMDTAVLYAYGWPDLALGHAFYEVDYLPEDERIRYTISPTTRKEVLKRLLLLNHVRYAEEQDEKAAQRALLIEANKALRASKGASKRQTSLATIEEREGVYKIVKQDTLKSLGLDFNTNMRDFGIHQGIYSVADAATMLNLPTDKISRWFTELVAANYEGMNSDEQTDAINRRISFHALIELYVIGKLRDAKISMTQILKARTELKARTDKQYPFATTNVSESLKLESSRIYFYLDGNENPITLDGSGQFSLDLIKEFFKAIEFDTEGIAKRLFPAKGNRMVVIDPTRNGGKAVLVSKSIPASTIASLYGESDSVADLAAEYGVDENEIRGALNYASIDV